MARNNVTTQAYTANSVNKDIDITDVDIVTVGVSGTFVGTLSFFVSDDAGTTWYPLLMTPANSATGATTTTGTGLFKADVTPYNRFRVGTTAYTSGTANARITSRMIYG